MRKLLIALVLMAATVQSSFAAVRFVDPASDTMTVNEGFETPYIAEITTQEGEYFTLAQMEAITSLRLYFGDTEYVSSTTCAACFDYVTYKASSKIVIDVASYNWTDGTATATLFMYSATYPDGLRVGTFTMTSEGTIQSGTQTPETVDYITETEMDTFSEWITQVGVTGTPTGTKYLRDDGTFQTVSSGSTDPDALDGDTVDDNLIDTAILKTATPANGTTDSVSTADQIYDWAVGVFLQAEVDGSPTNEINTITGDNAGTTSGLAITVAGAGTVSTAVAGNTVTITGTGDGTGTDDQTATEVPVTTTAFAGIFANGASSDTVQECLDLADDHTHAGVYEPAGITESDISDLDHFTTADEADGIFGAWLIATPPLYPSDFGTGAGKVLEGDTTPGDIGAEPAFDFGTNPGEINTDDIPEGATNKYEADTGTNTGDEPDASTTIKGIIEIADDTEALAGTDTSKAMTAAGVKIYADANDNTGTDDQTATEVPYSNTTSLLTATDTQAAIDEVEARVDTNDGKVTFPGFGTSAGTALEGDTTPADIGAAPAFDFGTGPNDAVQLDGTGKLPAVDGSQLTGITAGYLNITDFDAQTAWRMFYSNADGDTTEFAFGTVGYTLTSGGPSAVPVWTPRIWHKEATITDAENLAADARSVKAVPIFYNNTGSAITITRITGWSDEDNYSAYLKESPGEYDFGTVSESVIDEVACTTNGTNVFYFNATSAFDDGSIAAGRTIMFEHNSGSCGWVKIAIDGTY